MAQKSHSFDIAIYIKLLTISQSVRTSQIKFFKSQLLLYFVFKKVFDSNDS